ncbi:MAG: hypothetical protein L0211_17140 [Planctomycetaceae bacterium]|nr:hypothetical protein [Planctomycetaceae bacterium]
MIVLTLGPPLLAGAYWLAANSNDSPEFLAFAIAGMVIGLPIALAIVRFRPDLRSRAAGVFPWWCFLVGAGMLLLLALHCAIGGQSTFAAGFGSFAVLELGAMVLAAWGRTAPQTRA